MLRVGSEMAVLLCVLVTCSPVSSRHVNKRQTGSSIFQQGHITGTVHIHDLDEASGLAASRKHPGTLYSHNDHGGDPEVFAISTTGQLQAVFTITGVTSNDWEDIAVGKCAKGATEYCIYVGDTGDAGHARNNVFRFREPDVLQDQTINVDTSQILQFTWSETDCETLMVDPDANVYVVAKVDKGAAATIARLPNSAWGTGSRVDVSSTARIPVSSTHHDPVGGDISPDGNEVLLKYHEGMYYWNMQGSRDYMAVLQTPPTKVPYTQETQGESVCWDPSGNGYYTTSEGRGEPIYYYARQ